MKFTRTAYTANSVKTVLDEIVNDARLNDLPTINSDLHARRHSTEHPEQVRITVIVERVPTNRRA